MNCSSLLLLLLVEYTIVECEFVVTQQLLYSKQILVFISFIFLFYYLLIAGLSDDYCLNDVVISRCGTVG